MNSAVHSSVQFIPRVYALCPFTNLAAELRAAHVARKLPCRAQSLGVTTATIIIICQYVPVAYRESYLAQVIRSEQFSMKEMGTIRVWEVVQIHFSVFFFKLTYETFFFLRFY